MHFSRKPYLKSVRGQQGVQRAGVLAAAAAIIIICAAWHPQHCICRQGLGWRRSKAQQQGQRLGAAAADGAAYGGRGDWHARCQQQLQLPHLPLQRRRRQAGSQLLCHMRRQGAW